MRFILFYRKILVLFLLIFPFSFLLNAQTKWIQGNIIIDDTEDVAQGVFVTNKRTKHTTRSNFTGTFFIEAKVNDTLTFKSDIYENRIIILKQNLFDKDKIVVHLALQIINLQEAIIAKKLTGILTKDVDKGKKEDVITRLYEMLNVNPDVNPIKDTSNLKAGLLDGDIRLTGFDVGRLYDIFSGDLKKRKAVIEYENQTNFINSIRAYYGDNYFKKDLKIPGFKINEFIITALTNTNNIHQLKKPNFFTLQKILSDYSDKYLNDLYKLSDYKNYVTKDSLN